MENTETDKKKLTYVERVDLCSFKDLFLQCLKRLGAMTAAGLVFGSGFGLFAYTDYGGTLSAALTSGSIATGCFLAIPGTMCISELIGGGIYKIYINSIGLDITRFKENVKYCFFKTYQEIFLEKLKDYLIQNDIYDKYTIDEKELLLDIEKDIEEQYKKFLNEPFFVLNDGSNSKCSLNDYEQKKGCSRWQFLKDQNTVTAQNYMKEYPFFKNVQPRSFWQSISTSKPVEAIKSGWNSVKSWFGSKQETKEKIKSLDQIKTIAENLNQNKSSTIIKERTNVSVINNELSCKNNNRSQNIIDDDNKITSEIKQQITNDNKKINTEPRLNETNIVQNEEKNISNKIVKTNKNFKIQREEQKTSKSINNCCDKIISLNNIKMTIKGMKSGNRNEKLKKYKGTCSLLY